MIAHLGAGGAQRVAATAANALVERGIEVHLIKVFNDPGDAYAVDPRVHRYSLGAPIRAPKPQRGSFREMLDLLTRVSWSSELVKRAKTADPLCSGRRRSLVSAWNCKGEAGACAAGSA